MVDFSGHPTRVRTLAKKKYLYIPNTNVGQSGLIKELGEVDRERKPKGDEEEVTYVEN